MSPTPSIAIIGGGFSGLMVAANLIRLASRSITLYLIEKTPNLAKGVAYSTTDPFHLLNVPAVQMGVFAAEPAGFYQWVIEHEEQWRQADPSFVSLTIFPQAFLPRKLYGLYLQSIFKGMGEEAEQKNIRLECIQNEVLAIDQQGENELCLALRSQSLICDYAVLAIGLPPTKELDEVPPSIANSSHYISDIWSNQAVIHNLLELDKKGVRQPQILILGTGLTMVDACMSLFIRGFKGQVHALSKSGHLPEAHRHQDKSYFLKLPTPLPKTARALFRWIRELIKNGYLAGYDWRPLFDALRPYTQTLWTSLPTKEQLKAARLFSLWNKHRHRIPPHCLDRLTEQQQSGHLTLLAGWIESMTERNHVIHVRYWNSKKKVHQNLTVDAIWNCTGPTLDIRKNSTPILRDLISKGFLIFDHLFLGIQSTNYGQVKGSLFPRLYVIGGLCFGEKLETTAVPELKQQALTIAQKLCQEIELN